jgi:hypothetical protein
VTLNGTSWMMIVHKTEMLNQGRPFEWSLYCRWVAASPLTANFRFRSFLQPESANNSKKIRAGRKMSKVHR